MTPRILVVDDDEGVRYTLRNILEDAGLEVLEAADGQQALNALDQERPDLVLTDVRMPNLGGLELLQRLVARPGAPRVVLITAHGSERLAVEAMKNGAYDYFRKPFEPDELLAVVERAVESVRLSADRTQLQAELELSRSLIFESSSMKRLALMIHRFADKDVTVLVTSESGTGKERVAEAIVRSGLRKDEPFVRFNCAALTPELVDAELFGHEKGAFTGAVQARRGLFRQANRGTLFLDEVAELELRTQAKLLRVLQEQEVRPVGGDQAETIDVRIIAATHQDLESRVADGSFREDLYYRLKVVTLHLPPLRERPEDIVRLTEHFLGEFADRFGVPTPFASAELLDRLRAAPWPGNVRELRNTLESLVALSPRGSLDLSVLPDVSRPDAAALSLADRLRVYERGVLVDALAACRGNRSEAAKRLGIGRATLYEKLRKLDIQSGPD